MSEYLNPSDQLKAIKELFSNANIAAQSYDLKALFAQFDPKVKPVELRAWACERGVDQKAFDKAYHFYRAQERLGGYPDNVVELVDLFCKKHHVSVAFDSTITADDSLGRDSDLGSLTNDIYLCGAELHLPMAMRSKEAIGEALSKFVRTSRASQVTHARNSIIAATLPQAMDEWQRLAEAFADESQQSHAYVIRALQASVWQVKRKLVNNPAYPVTDHLMTILTGPQGSGKSTFWQKFFSPLAAFVYPADFKQLRDGKNFDLWRHPIVFFDEMAYAAKADIDEVKNAITSTHRTSRLHHSHSAANIRNSATFFGATNGSLGSIIFDKTGLRRFAPIATKAAPRAENEGRAVVDWEAINDIDFTRLWQSVDHTAAHPLVADSVARSEWAEIIEGERAQDAAEMFMRQSKFENGRYKLAQLFSLYRDFCHTNNERELSSRAFSRRLKDLEAMSDFPFIRGKSKGYETWTPITPAGGGNVVLLNPNVTKHLAAIDARAQ